MRQKLLLGFCIVSFCLANLTSQEAQAVKEKSLYIGLGLFSHNLTQVTQNSSGEPSFFGPIYYPFLAQSFFKLHDDWYIGPTLGYTILPRTSPEGGEKTSFLMVNSPFLRHFGPENKFDWSVGPGFIFYIIQGAGSTVLNNGNGTATFAVPGRTQYSNTISLNLGAGYTVDYIHLSLDTITEGILSSTRRAYSIMFSVTYNVLGGSL
jgi:hypothetical protein